MNTQWTNNKNVKKINKINDINNADINYDSVFGSR